MIAADHHAKRLPTHNTAEEYANLMLSMERTWKRLSPGRIPTYELDQPSLKNPDRPRSLLHLFLSIVSSDKKHPYLDVRSLKALSCVSKATRKLSLAILSDRVYVVLKTHDAASLLMTMPSPWPAAAIPAGYQRKLPSHAKDQVIFVFQNNGYVTVTERCRTRVEYLQFLEKEMPEKFQRFKKMYAYEIEAHLAIISKRLRRGQLNQEKQREYLTTNTFYDLRCQAKLSGIIMNQEHCLVTEAEPKLGNLMQKFGKAKGGIYAGEYLFRALRSDEWDKIIENRHMLVKDRELFEEKVGMQVTDDMKKPGYADVIIRIPNKRPCNSYSGIPISRISATLPHFISEDEIFVSKSAEGFIPLREWCEKERAIS